MPDNFLLESELATLGLKHFGKNVKISRKASLYSPQNMSFGNDVRIDDFCILSGNITFGDYIHIGAGGYFFAGKAGIEIDSFSTTSSRVVIYAISDDYSGSSMTNPMIPEKYKRVTEELVNIGKHVIIGTSSVILPGVTLNDGCSIGAMSLVRDSIPEWTVAYGIPAKPKRPRSKDLLKMEELFMKEKQMDI